MKQHNELREELADYAHESWAGWIKYMFAKCEADQEKQTLIIPAGLVERWTRQAETRYSELPESEKKLDRDEADKMIKIVRSY